MEKTIMKRKCRNCDDLVYQADSRMDLLHVSSDNYICTRRSGDRSKFTAAE